MIMSAISVGRVCVKIAGKDASKYCVVTDVADGNLVEITGPKTLTGVKRRKCNISHIEPTSDLVKIKAKASDDDVLKAVDSAKLVDKMKAGLSL